MIKYCYIILSLSIQHPICPFQHRRIKTPIVKISLDRLMTLYPVQISVYLDISQDHIFLQHKMACIIPPQPPKKCERHPYLLKRHFTRTSLFYLDRSTQIENTFCIQYSTCDHNTWLDQICSSRGFT